MFSPGGGEQKWCFDGQNCSARGESASFSTLGLMPCYTPGMIWGCGAFVIPLFLLPMLLSTYDFREQHFVDSSDFGFQI